MEVLQLIEVLLQNWSTGESAHISCASMRLELTKYVAIYAAFPYNRDQMRGQTSFDAHHIFLRAKGPDCPAPSALSFRRSTLYEVGAPTGANVHIVPASVQRGKHASIPRNPTIVRDTHYESTSARLQCKCSTSGSIALFRIISTSIRK